MGLPQQIGRIAAALLAATAAAAQPERAPESRPAVLLVRLRAEGPHAVTGSAATRDRAGRALAAATRDGSDSLDRLAADLGVREVRAVFRRSDGRPLEAQRMALRARADARRRALPTRTREALPPVPELAHVYRIELAPGADPVAAAARYAADPHVVWAQPSLAVSVDLAADDPFLASSGSWGQAYEDLWGILRVRAPEAWDVSQGEGIAVAVVDTGIDTAHPDLAANIWVNPGEDLDGDGRAGPADRNGRDDDGNGFIDDLVGFDFANSVDTDGDGDYADPGDVSDADPFDDYGHGTHVGGTIAAVANNGIGVAGVAPRARLMALKGFDADGSGSDEVLARAMVYAALSGARVINNSWSCSERCPRNPVLEEAQAFAASLGVVVVTSAGNSADDVVFYSPKWRADNIVVAATDQHDLPASFSNFGWLVSVAAPGSGDFDEPGVVLPQRAILSTRSSGTPGANDGNGAFTVGGEYLRWSGTSMSAPHVSGIAALILAHRPDLAPDEVRAVVRSAARDLDAPGHDPATGAGLADAAQAVAIAPPSARAVFTDPAPGAVVVPRDDEVEIRGLLTGAIRDVELSVGFGRYPSHFEPIPLASPLPIAPGPAGTLARWDVAAREDGPYVLRLEVRSDDGSGGVEFLPIAVERNAPTRLSTPGAAARAPAVSGDLVVWESDRPQDGAEEPGLDLFALDLSRRGEGEWRVVSAPGDQRSAALSGRRLAWLDARDHADEVRSCRVDGSRSPCADRIAAGGAARRRGPTVSGETLVWSERVADRDRLRGCTWRGARCEAVALPESAGLQLDPVLSGTRLWWREVVNDFVVLTCLGFPSRCAPAVVESAFSPAAIAGSRSLLAWTPLGGVVFVCRIAADGSCPPRLLGFPADPDRPIAISGDRVVWSAQGPGGDLDIFLCEDDPHTGACPVQRLTGSSADQRRPAISGARVVWEDGRDGEIGVFGLTLPSLDPIGNRTAVIGRTLRIAVRGRDPSGEPIALSAQFADGAALETRGAVFTDRGDGRGELRWTPRAADAGPHVVTFAGRTPGHLTTRRSVRIDVIE